MSKDRYVVSQPVLSLLAAALFGLTTVSCVSFEEAGESVDEGIEETGDAIEDAADEVEDETDDYG
jgi:hypothetical protein